MKESDKIIKYGLIILKDGKLLINRKYGTKLFLMPGGKREEGESVEDCIAREIKEEHECEIVKDSLKHFGDFEDMAANEPNTIVSVRLFTGKIIGEPQASSEIEEQVWFSKEDSQEILSPTLRNKIFPAILERGLLN